MAKVDFDKKKIVSKVRHNAEAFIRKITLDGMGLLVTESPVDTGRFKANWSTSVNKMDSSIVDALGGKTSKGRQSSPADFKRSSSSISKYKLNQTMFLYNNLEYALPLEFGTSQQAPAGWIRATANLMQKKLNEIKDLI